MVALSFTTILIQVQAAFQGNALDLLPILIAALLAMAGVARSLGARPGLARRSGIARLSSRCGEWRAFRLCNDGRAPAKTE
jgi:hypothetical protein